MNNVISDHIPRLYYSRREVADRLGITYHKLCMLLNSSLKMKGRRQFSKYDIGKIADHLKD